MNGFTTLSVLVVTFFDHVRAVSDAVTLTLAHFIWQGIVVALLYAIVSCFLRTRSANKRYIAAVVALFALAACPVVTLMVTSESTAVRTSGENEVPSNAVTEVRTSISSLIPAIPLEASGSATALHSVKGDLRRQTPMRWVEFSSPLVASCYLFGVVLMLFRLVRGILQGRDCAARSESLADHAIALRIAVRCRSWSMRSVPIIACCQRISVPVVVGVVRPMILIPPAILTGFTIEQIESMFIHELAHIRRHDPLIHFLQRIVESVLFFHPAVWYISRRMNIEREIACDDVVITAGWSASDYASTLLELADRNIAGATEWKATLLAASGDRPSQFKQRILRLLGEEQRGPQFDFNREEWAVAFLLLVSACGIFVGRPTVLAQSPMVPIAAEAGEREDLPIDAARSNSPDAPKSPSHSIVFGPVRGWGFDADLVVAESPFWQAVFEFLTQPKINEAEQNAAELIQDNPEIHAASTRENKHSQDDQYLFTAVRIEGNSSIPAHEIEKHIRVRAGNPVTRTDIKHDVEALVRTRWFASVEPTIRQSPEGPEIVFQLLERPIVRRVEYKGLKKIKQKVFDNLTQLKPGSPFDVASNRECARRIEEFYHDKGYAFATVELEKGNDRDDREVVFAIHEGPKVKVSSVKFEGSDEFNDGILKSVTRAKNQKLWLSGGKYDSSTIVNDIADVKRYYHMLGYFDVAVKEHLKFSDDKSRVEIRYEVSEGTRYSIRNIEINGNKILGEEEIRGMLKVKGGVPYNGRDINKDVESIKSKYGELRRMCFQVNAIPRWIEGEGSVDLEYRIDEGKTFQELQGPVEIKIDFAVPLIEPPIRGFDFLQDEKIKRVSFVMPSRQ